MISEAELLDVIRNSAIGQLCRRVEVLPSLSERGLLDALGKPPAVFASVRAVDVSGDLATVRYSLWVVAQNFRGHQAARQGDGVVLGLYDLAECVMAVILAEPGYVLGNFRPDGGEYADKYGVHTGEITCSAQVDLPDQCDLQALLTPFVTFHADYDVASSSTIAAPAAPDTVTLPQEL